MISKLSSYFVKQEQPITLTERELKVEKAIKLINAEFDGNVTLINQAKYLINQFDKDQISVYSRDGYLLIAGDVQTKSKKARSPTFVIHFKFYQYQLDILTPNKALTSDVLLNPFYTNLQDDMVHLNEHLKSCWDWLNHQDITRVYEELQTLISKYALYVPKKKQLDVFELTKNEQQISDQSANETSQESQETKTPTRQQILAPPLLPKQGKDVMYDGLSLAEYREIEKIVTEKLQKHCQQLQIDIKGERQNTSQLYIIADQQKAFETAAVWNRNKLDNCIQIALSVLTQPIPQIQSYEDFIKVDEASEHILDMESDKCALLNGLSYIYNKYQENDIELNRFLQYTRTISQQLFDIQLTYNLKY